MAGRPLRPATDRSLGGPLPRQQANQTQAPLQAHCCFNNCLDVEPLHYAVLANLSTSYSPPEGRLPTRYSPGRHSTQDRSPFRVRLACVRHAASVDSEPGSNSQSKILGHRNIIWLTFAIIKCSTNVRMTFCYSWSLKTKTLKRFDVMMCTLYLVFKYRSKFTLSGMFRCITTDCLSTFEFALRSRAKRDYIYPRGDVNGFLKIISTFF